VVRIDEKKILFSVAEVATKITCVITSQEELRRITRIPNEIFSHRDAELRHNYAELRRILPNCDNNVSNLI